MSGTNDPSSGNSYADGNPYADTAPVTAELVSPAGSNSSTSWILAIAVCGFGFLVCGGILTGLMLPAVQAAREAARRMSCSNNIQQIGLALHNYHAAYGQLPQAYTVDENGQPLHSWRVAVLPFMEQSSLYEQIDLNKPWDAPENQVAAATMVGAYSCPSRPGDPLMTTYLAVVDPSGMMTGPIATSFSEARDGLSNTIMIVEADPDQAVHWMSPDDIGPQEFLAAGDRHDHVGGSHVLFSDGAVKFITDSIDRDRLEALMTKGGGETIDN